MEHDKVNTPKQQPEQVIDMELDDEQLQRIRGGIAHTQRGMRPTGLQDIEGDQFTLGQDGDDYN